MIAMTTSAALLAQADAQDEPKVSSQPNPVMELGSILATPGSMRMLASHHRNAFGYLYRHEHGDWGDLDAEDLASNNEAVQSGARIHSAYRVGESGSRLWVITEAKDAQGHRACTTVLLPQEY